METKGMTYLRTAGIILIAAGIFDTIMIVRAFMTQSSYSGGSVIYIIAGYFLIKKNESVYKKVRMLGLPVLALCFAGILSTITSTYMKVMAGITSDNSFDIQHLMNFYLLLALVVMALLWHPETQKVFFEKIDHTRIYTLFVKKRYFIFVVIGSIALYCLLHGPHLIQNPYHIGKTEIEKHYASHFDAVKNSKVVCMWEQTHNWTFFSRWKYITPGGEIFYHIAISPRNDIRISYLNENHGIPDPYSIIMRQIRQTGISAIRIHQYKGTAPDLNKEDIVAQNCLLIAHDMLNSYLDVLLRVKATRDESGYTRYANSYYIALMSKKKVLFEFLVRANDRTTSVSPLKTFTNQYGGITYYHFAASTITAPNIFTQIKDSEFKSSADDCAGTI